MVENVVTVSVCVEGHNGDWGTLHLFPDTFKVAGEDFSFLSSIC